MPRPIPPGAPKGGVRADTFVGWTLASDPNSIVQSTTNAANGMTVRLQNPAISRSEPGSAGGGATWVRAGFRDVYGTVYAIAPLPDAACRIRLYEQQIPATTPNLMRVTYGFMDNADPSLATTGIGVSLTYDATNTRKTGIVRCTGLNTWAPTIAGTGQATCFGADLSWRWITSGALLNLSSQPVSSLRRLGAVGSNTATSAANQVASALTHEFLCVGWTGVGTTGDSITISGAYWIDPLLGGG